jgi:pyruvate-ferredoxin/flavodoxin oxidoreductase
MEYGHVYVASVSMGANRQQCLNALVEAESYKGPSLVIAYCPCQEHGIKGSLSTQQQVQKNAVACGYTTLYRFDPRKDKPLTIDSKEPDFTKLRDFVMNETRFSQLPIVNPEHAEELLTKCETYAKKRWADIKKFGE